jgi:hypothetical protein
VPYIWNADMLATCCSRMSELLMNSVGGLGPSGVLRDAPRDEIYRENVLGHFEMANCARLVISATTQLGRFYNKAPWHTEPRIATAGNWLPMNST